MAASNLKWVPSGDSETGSGDSETEVMETQREVGSLDSETGTFWRLRERQRRGLVGVFSDGPSSLCEPVTTTANEAKKLRDPFLENYSYKPRDSAPLSVRRGKCFVCSWESHI